MPSCTVGHESYQVANVHYNLLAQMVREAQARPATGVELDALVTFFPPNTQSNTE